VKRAFAYLILKQQSKIASNFIIIIIPIIIIIIIIIKMRDSSFGIATGYGLDGKG
jgi:hypothetical protein